MRCSSLSLSAGYRTFCFNGTCLIVYVDETFQNHLFNVDQIDFNIFLSNIAEHILILAIGLKIDTL